jgi:hypothetical protein
MGRQITLCPVGIVRRFTLRTGVLRLDAYLMSLRKKSMNKEEAIAELALRELARKEKLREIVTQPGYRYYFGRGIIGLFAGIISAVLLVMMIARDNISAWGYVVGFFSISAFLEATRQRGRFNALIELREIEKKESEANQTFHRTGNPAVAVR